MKNRRILSVALLAMLAPSARADSLLVRIGDVDGFGYGAAPGFKAANGGNANTQNSTVLTKGDYLPDVNRDRAVATGRGDDFDQRSAAEIAGDSYTVGAGVAIAVGTTGSQFTDVSLSTSYDASSAANKVLTGGNPGPPDTRVFGAGGAFPSPPSSSLPNQPGFVFQFSTSSALNAGDPIYLNMIFGDYDVRPASIKITDSNGATRTLGLTAQPAGADGLIQAAFATLTYADVFAGADPLNGYLKVDFDAPNEPYTAFDYVELSTEHIDINPVPEPASLAMLGVGALAAFGLSRRRKTASRGV